MRGAFLVAALLLAVSLAAPGSAQTVFDATFTPKPGNSWWVETSVSANQALAGVDARVNGGSWIALAKQSWGTWAKSINAPDGSTVEFRARSTSGATDTSGGYRWPSATPVGTTPPPPQPALTFDHLGGNEWWVEVRLGGSSASQVTRVKALDLGADGVDSQDDDFVSLTKRSWGAWTGSLHVEPGHMVRFIATLPDGGSMSSCAFTHPAGEERCGTPAPPAADTAFGPKAGNAWWVETFAFTGKSADDVRLVEARVNGGPWKPLTLRSWGAWAGSFHVPDGSHVEFRSSTPAGQAVSMPFLWPRAIPLSSEGEWPEEGSYVHYRLAQGVASETHTRLDAVFVHHEGSWWMECKGTDFGEPSYQVDYSRAPPFGALRTTQEPIRPIAVGDEVQVGTLFDCQPGIADIIVQETHVHDTRNDGKTVPVAYWYGVTGDDGCGGCNYRSADWDKATGLVAWVNDGGTGWSWAQIQDTDAPLQRA